MIITRENYFSPEATRAYYSASQVKAFLDCEARATAELRGEWRPEPGVSMMVGSYVDAHFSRELDVFRAAHPEIYTRGGELRSEYRQAEEIIARIERDALAMRMMGGEAQKTVTGTVCGYPFRAKLDGWLSGEECDAIAAEFPGMADALLYAPGAIVDMKVMRDFAPLYRDGEGRLNFVEYWKYDLQLAIYQRLAAGELRLTEAPDRKGGPSGKASEGCGRETRAAPEAGRGAYADIPCFILAASKEKETDIALYGVPQSLLDAALTVAMEQMERIAAVKAGEEAPARCEACDYCRRTRVLSGPTWFETWE